MSDVREFAESMGVVRHVAANDPSELDRVRVYRDFASVDFSAERWISVAGGVRSARRLGGERSRDRSIPNLGRRLQAFGPPAVLRTSVELVGNAITTAGG